MDARLRKRSDERVVTMTVSLPRHIHEKLMTFCNTHRFSRSGAVVRAIRHTIMHENVTDESSFLKEEVR